MTKFEFEAIGTHWEIDITKELSASEKALLHEKIKSRIDQFDKVYSRFREDSTVFEMSKKSGEYTLPLDADLLLSTYKKVYDKTFGLVTPLIGQVLIDAGYDHKYSLIPKETKVPPKWEEVLEWNNPVLNVKKPEMLDFGAGGKGYLVDLVSELLIREEIDDFCVDAGGDMRKIGEELSVGLEHPEKKDLVIGKIKIKNQSLCGSAGNRRVWADYHHVINPETLKSPKNILAVWTLAKTTLLADILTTAVYFVSPEILKNHFDFEYLLVREDGKIEKSEGFKAEIFTS